MEEELNAMLVMSIDQPIKIYTVYNECSMYTFITASLSWFQNHGLLKVNKIKAFCAYQLIASYNTVDVSMNNGIIMIVQYVYYRLK